MSSQEYLPLSSHHHYTATANCLQYPLTLQWWSLHTWHKQQPPPCITRLSTGFLPCSWQIWAGICWRVQADAVGEDRVPPHYSEWKFWMRWPPSAQVCTFAQAITTISAVCCSPAHGTRSLNYHLTPAPLPVQAVHVLYNGCYRTHTNWAQNTLRNSPARSFSMSDLVSSQQYRQQHDLANFFSYTDARVYIQLFSL